MSVLAGKNPFLYYPVTAGPHGGVHTKPKRAGNYSQLKRTFEWQHSFLLCEITGCTKNYNRYILIELDEAAKLVGVSGARGTGEKSYYLRLPFLRSFIKQT